MMGHGVHMALAQRGGHYAGTARAKAMPLLLSLASSQAGSCRRLSRRCKVRVPAVSSPSRDFRHRCHATTGVLETSDGLCYLQECRSQLVFPMTLPIMPFTPTEALAPGCTKVLHLYEDKDLELLDTVLSGTISQSPSASCDGGEHDQGCVTTADIGQHQNTAASPAPGSRARVFVHTTIEMGSSRTPCVACASSTPGALVAGEFVFFLSTLVQVLDVQPAAHGGVDVTIRGEGRVRISRLRQLNPYITGEVWPVQDVVPRDVLYPPNQQDSSAVPTADTHQSAALELESRWTQPPQEHPEDIEQYGRARTPPPTTDAYKHTPPPHLDWPGSAAATSTSFSADDPDCFAASAEALGTEGSDASGLVLKQAPVEVADAGTMLHALVQDVRGVAEDVQGLMRKLGRDQQAASLLEAMDWADEATPLMCNLGSGQSAAELWLLPPSLSTHAEVGQSSAAEDAGAEEPFSCAALPCAVSQLDKATRLSFALLALAQGMGAGGAGDPSWAGGSAAGDLRRAALCTLDTWERLQLVLKAAKSVRARLAAEVALWRVRRF